MDTIDDEKPRPRTSDLAEFLRSTGPADGGHGPVGASHVAAAEHSEHGMMSRLKLPFLRSRKKSQALRTGTPSIPLEKPPVPPKSEALQNMRALHTQAHERADHSIESTFPPAAAQSPRSSGDMLHNPLRGGPANKRHSAYDYIEPHPTTDGDFTEVRVAPNPPRSPPIGSTFSPLLRSPALTEGSPGTPTSRLNFPHPPPSDTRPPLASHKSLDSLPHSAGLPISGSGVFPPSQTFPNIMSMRTAADGDRPELNRRPSRVRLNWADTRPLKPLVAPTTHLEQTQQSSSDGHPSPPTPSLHFMKSPTSTSAKTRFSALIDEVPPSAPPSYPPPAAPMTSFSMRSLPSIPSIISSPEDAIEAPRVQTTSLPGSAPRPPVSSYANLLRRTSKEELVRELGSNRVRFDEIAGFLQKILTSHEEAKQDFDKRLELLETEVRKRDEEIRGLRWLVMNVDASSMGVNGQGPMSAVDPPAVSQLSRGAPSGVYIPERDLEGKSRLKRSNSLPRNLSLSSFSLSLDLHMGDTFPPAPDATLPTPPGSSMQLDSFSTSVPAAPSISQPTLLVTAHSAVATQYANDRSPYDHVPSSPTGSQPPENKLRKLQLLVDREAKSLGKPVYQPYTPVPSAPPTKASLAYARNLDDGMAPSIDGLLSQTPTSSTDRRI